MDQHEQRNRERWDQMSDWYQAVHGLAIKAAPDAWRAWRVPEAELRFLPEIDGKDVLELGCGAGQWSAWLAGHGARVTGLGLPRRQLEHAREHLAAARVTARLVQASAESVPFREASFDLVLSDHGAMSCGDPDRTVPEVARVLRPGEVLVFCTTTPLFAICGGDRGDGPGDRLLSDYFGWHGEMWSRGAMTFNLPYGGGCVAFGPAIWRSTPWSSRARVPTSSRAFTPTRRPGPGASRRRSSGRSGAKAAAERSRAVPHGSERA